MSTIGQSIKIDKVSKFYGSFQALDHVSLEAKPGEFLTILGSSGSGKTTLLKIIAGFEACNDGQIIINDEDVAGKKSYERNIGMLFQNYALFPHMTVEENIAYPLKLRKVPKDKIKEQVAYIIKLIKLEGMEKRYPKQLSGGQQQRVALARAIVYNPPLLLLDEPLGALDKNLRQEMQFEIKRIQKELGITTISVTHDQEEALTMSDKICIMNHGVIQQCSSPEEIYKQPKNQFVAEFIGSTNLVNGTVVSKKLENDRIVTMVQTGLSKEPMRVEEPASYRKYNLKDIILAIRPELIHLMKERKGHTNSFKGKIINSVYMGDYVRAQVMIADGSTLNVKISPEAFRQYGGENELEFFFNPDCVTTIYEREKGVMLKTVD
ncbi:MAG: ABC transporter ATP-binding protein [Ruminococcus sp.]|nr:ABC transporter ATP-binding protein [Ruminococcus sp.]